MNDLEITTISDISKKKTGLVQAIGSTMSSSSFSFEFVLDNTHYVVTGNPDDGYRSYLDYIHKRLTF